jgi:hypothetical protein
MDFGNRLIAWFQQVADAFYNLPLWKFADSTLHQFEGALHGKPIDATQALIDGMLAVPIPQLWGVSIALQSISGKKASVAGLNPLQDWKALIDNPSELIANKWHDYMTNPAVAELAEVLGSVSTESVIALLDDSGRDSGESPLEYFRRLRGSIQLIQTASSLLGPAVESVTGGQVETLSQFMSDFLQSSGISYVNSQLIQAIISTGIEPRINAYYRTQNRPTRFSAAQLIDLMQLGRRNEAVVRGELAALGWRDVDIDDYIRLAQTSLSEGEILNGYDLGMYDQAATIAKLKAVGLAPETAEEKMRLVDKQKAQDIANSIAAIARSAFKKKLIDESRFRSLLSSAKVPGDRIDLEVALSNMETSADDKDLSVGQVKSAFKSGVLVEGDLPGYLRKAKVDEAAIPVLMATWKAELVPDVVRLNSSTLSTAYVDGVITRAVLKSRLIELGWNDGDAEIVCKIADQRIAEKSAAVKVVTVRRIGLSDIEQAFKRGIVTEQAALDLLRSISMLDSDIQIVIATWKAEQVATPLELTQDAILTAYRYGVVERDAASQRLIGLGMTSDDADILLAVADEKIIAAQAEPTPVVEKTFTVSVIRAALVAGVITDTRAQTLLADIKVPASLRDVLIATWTAAKAETPKRLSTAAITAAYADTLISRSDALSQLTTGGLSSDDADLLLRMVERSFAEQTPTPTQDQVLDAFGKGIVTYDDAHRKLITAGVTDLQADFLLRAYAVNPRIEVKPISEANVLKLLKLGEFDETEAIRRLVLLGYDDTNARYVIIASTSKVATSSSAAEG